MDLYETYRKAISPMLMRRSVDLSLLGVRGAAWLYPTAITVIECVDEMGGKVLGGDVLSIDGCGMRATGDSWYFVDGLSGDERAAASIDYIERYRCKNGNGYAYRLVFQYEAPGQDDLHVFSAAFQDPEGLSIWASRLALTWSDVRYGFFHCYLGQDDVASFAMKLVEGPDASLVALKLAYEENGVNETKELLRDVTEGDYDEQGARELWRHICCLERLAAV